MAPKINSGQNAPAGAACRPWRPRTGFLRAARAGHGGVFSQENDEPSGSLDNKKARALLYKKRKRTTGHSAPIAAVQQQQEQQPPRAPGAARSQFRPGGSGHRELDLHLPNARGNLSVEVAVAAPWGATGRRSSSWSPREQP